ncbi:MAG: alkaline phosphatase D family protein [Bacteroidota bacterium]
MRFFCEHIFKGMLVCILFSPVLLPAQGSLIQSGPMVGFAEMKEVSIWVQTKEAATVQLSYWRTSDPKTLYYTDSIHTKKDRAFTAHLFTDQVEPGESYAYQVLVNSVPQSFPYKLEFTTPSLWQWRTDPPAFSIAMGSCTYVNEEIYDRPGKPYGGDYEIFRSILDKDPDLMLWLGDNTYLREVDWYSRTGIIHRYTHTRSLPELQALLASVSHYAIWDDHDYGPDNSDRSFGRKALSRDVFSWFWANPTVGVADWGGTTTMFEWGDAQFFLLDNRSFRSPNNKKTEQRTLLGEDQFTWLIDALVSSEATFKFVCVGGQVLNPVDRFETYSNVAPEERLRLLRSIVQEGIENVFFISGDRHHSELSFLEREQLAIYDITTSPLTSGSHNHPDEANTLRVKGSYIGQRNFSILRISGPREERKLLLTYFDTFGKELWSYTINAQ